MVGGIFFTQPFFIAQLAVHKHNKTIHMTHKARNSNIEMLRIISMAMILMLHFIGATFGLPTHAQMLGGDPVAVAKAVTEAAAIVGVNCFVLISGYYGIRATWRGAFGYIFMCEFAALFVYAVRCIDRGGLADGFGQTLMVLSDTNLWFVPAYFVLYLLSPILNSGFASLHGRRLHLMLGIMAFINIYLGWYHGGSINHAGYNIMHLIFIYFIGHYISRNASITKRLTPAIYFLIYGIMVCVTALSLNYAYNSPSVLLSSAALFLAFATMRPRHSSIVNWIASSVFMVYLLHKSPYCWLKLNLALRTFEATHSRVEFLLWAAALFVLIFAASILVDQARKYVYTLVLRGLRRFAYKQPTE